MTKYGPMIGDESVEDAGDPEFDKKGKRVKGGELPSATGSFLDLADENSSHFSPENIRLNFKPKHLMAMDMGAEAWSARNPGKPRSRCRRATRRTPPRRPRRSRRSRAPRPARGCTRRRRSRAPRRPAPIPRRPVAARPGRDADARPRRRRQARRGVRGAGAHDVRLRRPLPHGRVRRRPVDQRRPGPQGGAEVVGGRTGRTSRRRSRATGGARASPRWWPGAIPDGQDPRHPPQARPRPVQRARPAGPQRQGHPVGHDGGRQPGRLARHQGAGRGGDQGGARRRAGLHPGGHHGEAVRGAGLRARRGDAAAVQGLAADRERGQGPRGLQRGLARGGGGSGLQVRRPDRELQVQPARARRHDGQEVGAV